MGAAILLFALKIIIHAKRFLTAFFVKAVFKPMAFIGRILLNIFVVPFYRLYALINRKISASPKAGRKIGYLLTSRYVLPALFILIAVILTTGNLTNRSVPLSSSELVGKTLLSQ